YHLLSVYSASYYLLSIFLFLIIRLPPLSTLFPYTTLFRSRACERPGVFQQAVPVAVHGGVFPLRIDDGQAGLYGLELILADAPRSEEHTSELQSRENLVCRLLLEKKKKK